MREIIVKYTISDDDEKRLQLITEKFMERGLNLSPDKQFEIIMQFGCKHDIDEKFKFHECQLGLRED